MDPVKLVARCCATGLDWIAVTDHNTIAGAIAVQNLASFPVIIGEEIRTNCGEIIGLFLKETIPEGLSPLETVRTIKEQGGLVSVPHPFDHFRKSVIGRTCLEEILDYVDIIEGFNARNSLQNDNRMAKELADRNAILVSAVSDAHTITELGRTYIETPVETPEFENTPSELQRAIAMGSLVCRPITPLIHVVTTLTKLKKKLLGVT